MKLLKNSIQVSFAALLTLTTQVSTGGEPLPSDFVKVFPMKISTANPADITRPAFKPLEENLQSVAANKLIDWRGYCGIQHNANQGVVTSLKPNVCGANGVFAGGTVVTTNKVYKAMTWKEAHGGQWNNSPGMKINSANGNLYFEGFDIRGAIDGIIPSPTIPNTSRCYFNGLHIIECKDDCIQNDGLRAITVQNAYLQGHVILSQRPGKESGAPASGMITEFENCLFHLDRQPYTTDEKGTDVGYPGSKRVGPFISPTQQNSEVVKGAARGYAHKWFFKTQGATPGFFKLRLKMKNCLLRIDTIPVEGVTIPMFPPIGDGVGPGSVKGSSYENVVVIWLGGGAWPFEKPPAGVTIITDINQGFALWEKTRQAWYEANGYDSATDTFSWTRVPSKPPTVPAAPSGLKASVASSSQINLTWADNSSNETGFKIERMNGSGGTFTQIATVGSNVISYRDEGLAPDAPYSYRVRASNGVSSSAYSNTVIVKTLPLAVVPATPTALAVTAQSSTQAILTWKDNSDNETTFRILRKEGETGSYAYIKSVGENVTSFNDKGLKPNTLYYYKVRAMNAAGGSGYSNAASVKTPGSVVSITVTDYRTSEIWRGVASWEVSRTGDTSTDLTVNYTVGGTATNGVDYRANTPTKVLSGNVVIPAGSASTQIKVWAYSDSVSDPDETIEVTLAPGSDYEMGTPTGGTAIIRE